MILVTGIDRYSLVSVGIGRYPFRCRYYTTFTRHASQSEVRVTHVVQMIDLRVGLFVCLGFNGTFSTSRL